MACQPYEDFMAKYAHKSYSNRKSGMFFEDFLTQKKKEMIFFWKIIILADVKILF